VSVMTHAQIRPTTADYRTLTPEQQDRFDALMEQADVAGSNYDYRPLLDAAAATVGLALPAGHEIRKCGCSCWCGHIFDANHPDAHVIEQSGGYNLGRIQCPTCADRHRETASG
jgi:hypothetical protein